MKHKSRIIDNELGDYLQEIYGREISDEEFLRNPNRLNEYLKPLIKIRHRGSPRSNKIRSQNE